MSLALIPSAGLPPARAALVALNEKITGSERQLSTLQSGKARLEFELGKAAEAKSELQALVAADAMTLVDRLRAGGQWLLSSFGNSRARELSVALSESRIQAAVGEKALASISQEAAVLERRISDLKAQRPDAVRAVLIEVAAGFRQEYAETLDTLRDLAIILAGLEKITGPNRVGRVVATVPSFTWAHGLGEQAVAAPRASIAAATDVWSAYAKAVDDDALAAIDLLKFPDVDANADDGQVSYETLHPAERRLVDLEHAGIGANQ